MTTLEISRPALVGTLLFSRTNNPALADFTPGLIVWKAPERPVPDKTGGKRRARVVSNEVAPFVFYDEFEGGDEDEWIDIQAQALLPPKATSTVTLEVERVGQAPILPLAIDDVDLELFDL